MYKRNDAHIQILLELEQLFLKEGRFNIWLQFLLDSKMQVSGEITYSLLENKISLGESFSYLYHLPTWERLCYTFYANKGGVKTLCYCGQSITASFQGKSFLGILRAEIICILFSRVLLLITIATMAFCTSLILTTNMSSSQRRQSRRKLPKNANSWFELLGRGSQWKNLNGTNLMLTNVFKREKVLRS